MCANGPVIWGGCVTRRSIRAVPNTRDGTSARKLSRCKEGMAHFLPSWYKLSRSQKLVKVQDFNCVQMRALPAVATAKAGVRVQHLLQNCLGCRSKSKNHDKQLTHIVRVINCCIFKSHRQTRQRSRRTLNVDPQSGQLLLFVSKSRK